MCEACRSLSFSLESFITPILTSRAQAWATLKIPSALSDLESMIPQLTMFPEKTKGFRVAVATRYAYLLRSQVVRAWLLLMSLGLGLKLATCKRAWGIARPKRDGQSPWDKIVLSDQPFSQEAAPPRPVLEETQQRKKTWALKRPKSINRNGRTAPRAARRRTHNPGSSVHLSPLQAGVLVGTGQICRDLFENS